MSPAIYPVPPLITSISVIVPLCVPKSVPVVTLTVAPVPVPPVTEIGVEDPNTVLTRQSTGLVPAATNAAKLPAVPTVLAVPLYIFPIEVPLTTLNVASEAPPSFVEATAEKVPAVPPLPVIPADPVKL